MPPTRALDKTSLEGEESQGNFSNFIVVRDAKRRQCLSRLLYYIFKSRKGTFMPAKLLLSTVTRIGNHLKNKMLWDKDD